MSKLKTLKDCYEWEDDGQQILHESVIQSAARECIKQQAIGNDPWLNKYPEGNSDEAFIKWFFNLEDD